MISEEEFDFILIRQKEYILNLLDTRRYTEARCCLTILCELWTKHGYLYKYEEIQERIRKCQMVHKTRLSSDGGNTQSTSS